MDWTKAKTILIIALIITNCVLIATYFFQEYQFNSDDEKVHDTTIKLLENKNIFIETDIPKTHERMPKLTVQYDKIDSAAIDQQIANHRALMPDAVTEDNLIALTTEFIEQCNLMTENVTFDKIERDGDSYKIIYKNFLGEYQIEESYINFTVTRGKITDVKRFWLNPIEVSDIKKEVIPAVTALIRFMSENTEEERIRVQDISLVYWVDSNDFDSESALTDTAFPTWRITYNGGKVQYITAWEQ